MQEISSEEIIQRIRVENPWWGGEHTVGQTHREWAPRAYFDLFFPLIKAQPVRRAVVLMGPRRVGKTVMIHHAIQALLDEGVRPESICYFSVDHPIYNGLSLEKLLSYSSQGSGVDYKNEQVYIFFDEIQYLRDWEVHLKSAVDTYSNIKAVASGCRDGHLRSVVP